MLRAVKNWSNTECLRLCTCVKCFWPFSFFFLLHMWMILLVCCYKTNQIIAERLIISPVWCKILDASKTFYWILLCPCLTLNVGIATAGEGPIDHSLAAQYCISGKQNYKVIQPYFSKHNHEKLLKKLPNTLSLTQGREKSLGKKKNGYMEPIHITNPCRNFSDSCNKIIFKKMFSGIQHWIFL